MAQAGDVIPTALDRQNRGLLDRVQRDRRAPKCERPVCERVLLENSMDRLEVELGSEIHRAEELPVEAVDLIGSLVVAVGEMIDSGAAQAKLEALVKMTQGFRA